MGFFIINILTLLIKSKYYRNIKMLLKRINDNKNNVLNSVKIAFYGIAKYFSYKIIVIG